MRPISSFSSGLLLDLRYAVRQFRRSPVASRRSLQLADRLLKGEPEGQPAAADPGRERRRTRAAKSPGAKAGAGLDQPVPVDEEGREEPQHER